MHNELLLCAAHRTVTLRAISLIFRAKPLTSHKKTSARGAPKIRHGEFDEYDVGDHQIDVARRLALSRILLGGEAPAGSKDPSKTTQKAFGKKAGFSQPRYQAYESGARRLTLDAGLAMCGAYHQLSLDWLYRGDTTSLSTGIVDKYRELLRRRPDLPRQINDELEKAARERAAAQAEKKRKKKS